jgi:hypothetical protein
VEWDQKQFHGNSVRFPAEKAAGHPAKPATEHKKALFQAFVCHKTPIMIWRGLARPVHEHGYRMFNGVDRVNRQAQSRLTSTDRFPPWHAVITTLLNR